MIKSLVYGGIAAGTVAAAALVTTMMTASESSSHPTSCAVTLDANGGVFVGGTNTEKTVAISYGEAIEKAYDSCSVTNVNFDLVGWTATRGGRDFIANATPVVSNVHCFAKWERATIQRFQLTNGVFRGSVDGAGLVAQFPAVFLGTAWAYDTMDHVISFQVPQNATNGGYRVSFDPQVGNTRIGANVSIDQDGVVTNLTFSTPTTEEKIVNFIPGAWCEIRISHNCSASVNYSRYAFGIGLEGVQVSFDSNEKDPGASYGTLSFTKANYTQGYPYGVLPTVTTPYQAKITFKGWYSSRRDGTALASTDVAGTNEVYYAQWKFPSVPYTVRFWKVREDAEGQMEDQQFQTEVAQALTYNRFYCAGYGFSGWSETSGGAKKYDDGETVLNLCEKADGIVDLYAVWKKTPGRNSYTVSQYVNDFKNVAISTNSITTVNGTGSYPTFTLSVTNSATLRVSLDPKPGTLREGAALSVDKQIGGGWTNVSSVTDLATTNVLCSFEAGATYRFAVNAKSASYGYVVGLGAAGAQIEYDSCDVLDMSFVFSVDTPYGYWPMLPSGVYGTHLGWFCDKDITHTNAIDTAAIVLSNATVYAHWSNQPYYLFFNGNGATNTTPYVQSFNYDRSQSLSRNRFNRPENRFLGWSTNSLSDEVVYRDGEVVSNLCTVAGATKPLYAVWEQTLGTNWYYVAGGVTDFGTIAVSQGRPTRFVGKGDLTQFLVTPVNVADCRVAIDPQEGYPRVGAELAIDYAVIPTNETEALEWRRVCTGVSDLAEKATTCSFVTNRYYRFTVTGVASTNGYIVSVGDEGARYIFDVCGGSFVNEETTTKVKFYDWTVGSPIGYTPPATTNAYVHGTNTWHYTPQMNEPVTNKIFSVTNLVVSGGEKIYAHWSDAVIVGIVFDWNLPAAAATNIVFTNYYGQGADVYLYNDKYVRQPVFDKLGFLGWTTNKATTAGVEIGNKLENVSTNSPNCFYAQWTTEWKTSRTEGDGLSIDGSRAKIGSTLTIPERVKTVAGFVWPVDVTAIGESAFTNSLFTTLVLPETLTRIESSAFFGCAAFSSLNIPMTVTFVGDSAFEDCTALTTVSFPSGDTPDEYAESGFLDGVFDIDNPSVNLGTCLFKGCISLKTVELPLGVNCIPDECFSGCTALTAFDKMPYTVVRIGDEAFAGCTHLASVTLTEVVSTIGESAFLKCARLKSLRFLGNQPTEIGSNILKGTPRNVLVAYLENLCENAADYCGGDWPELPGTWPSGDSFARTLTWLGGSYPRRKVVFNYNDKETLLASTKKNVLFHSGRVFGLLAPTEVEGENDFAGWYTQPVGGRKIGSYWGVPSVSEGGTAPITVYAHWGSSESESGGSEIGSRSAEEYPVRWPGAESGEGDFDSFTGFYSADDDLFYYAACTFDGIVFDESTMMIAGLVTFVFGEGGDSLDGGMSAPFTATITWNDGKKTSISGLADAESHLVTSNRRWSFGEGDEATVVTKSGIYGWLIDEDEESASRIYAARNRYATATDGAAWEVVHTSVLATRGTWHVVLEADAPEGEGADFAYGYTTLVVAIGDEGRATIKGTLGDGTSVATTSRLIVGDACCCLPVNIRPYSGKGGFAFMLWFSWQADGSFDEEDASVQGLTDWDATLSAHPFAAGLVLAQPMTFIDDRLCTDTKSFLADGVDLTTITMKGKSWSVPTGEDNPNQVKLSYDSNTGVFTGSFIDDPEGESKKAVVTGVLTDRIEKDSSDTYKGFGTAVIKSEGTYQVTIE